MLDEAGLQSEGMTSDMPVTIRATNIKLESALTLMLRPLRLSAIVTEEVLFVTSSQLADKYTTYTKVYPVNDQDSKVEELVALVQSKVEPSSWEEVGGGGSVSGINGGLVIRQAGRVHVEVRDLLERLGQHSSRLSRD